MSIVEVIPRLFISGLEAASNKEQRKSKAITYIVSLGCQIDDDECTILAYSNILDLPNVLISAIFDPTNDFISKALSNPSNGVLVHCIYGQSRSASVVCNLKYRSLNFLSFSLCFIFTGCSLPNGILLFKSSSFTSLHSTLFERN